MNWLGGGLVSFVAAAIGALLGAIAHFEGRRRGLDFPPLVGILAGLAAALASREKSGLRGALVASLAVWAAALAEILGTPGSGVLTARGVLADIGTFYQRLPPLRALAYLACAASGGLLASRAMRRPAAPPDEAAGGKRRAM